MSPTGKKISKGMERNSFLSSLPKLKDAILTSPSALDEVYLKSEQNNPWFIRRFLEASVEAILQQFIDPEKCKHWLQAYPEKHAQAKRVGLIMAGNIPLVGFHDLFCVLAAGQKAVIKLSDKDSLLLPFITDQWIQVCPGLSDSITYAERLDKIDTVIATGSNNSGRYFEYYFRQYPHVFRQNRNGVAFLTGAESMTDLKNLAKDIFMFFGLGCRNVSKIYVPAGYDFSQWNEAIADWSFLGDHNKYRNNLDYNYAIYLINSVPHINLGHLILKEDEAIVSRIACLHYSYYEDSSKVETELDQQRDEIQCVVSASPFSSWEHVAFGETQSPRLDQYADGVDTLQFLTSLV
jgi:hypothetical protein